MYHLVNTQMKTTMQTSNSHWRRTQFLPLQLTILNPLF